MYIYIYWVGNRRCRIAKSLWQSESQNCESLLADIQITFPF